MRDLAIIYSNRNQECNRAVALMDSLEQSYIVYNLGVDFTQEQFTKEFGEGVEYPQISLGIKHIGSLKETLQHFNYIGKL